MAENSWDLWDSYPVSFSSFTESTDNQSITLDSPLTLLFNQLNPTITVGGVNINLSVLNYVLSIIDPSINNGSGNNNYKMNRNSFGPNVRALRGGQTLRNRLRRS